MKSGYISQSLINAWVRTLARMHLASKVDWALSTKQYQRKILVLKLIERAI